MNFLQVETRFAVLLLTSILGLGPLSAQGISNSNASERKSAEFVVGRDGRPLLVLVSLDGKDFRFIVDTGAGKTAFDRSLRTKLGVLRGEQRLRTSAGFLSVEVFDCPQAKIGPWGLDRIETVLCLDLQPIRMASGQDIFGVLGMDFLRSYAMDVDFDRGRMRLMESAPQKWMRLGHRVPLSWKRGCPVAMVELPGKRHEGCFVDTGANITTVRTNVYDALSQEELLKPSDGQKSWTVSGEVDNRIGFVDQLTLGPFSHRNLRLDRDPMSALGLNYLSRYRLRCDFPNSVLIVDKGERFDKPEPNATSGMAILQIDGRKVVHRVHPDGPADLVGLQRGDIIVELDRRQASKLDMFELGQKLMFEPDRKVSIKVERGNKTLSVDLLLKRR
ncbi:aspartyl protease family protein [Aeoliella sp.]|uniref:aspartyl protease family protein n=1 Tax=Aeoliella sp. TaxID=2795800 RepID=UPI003CCBC95D